MQPCEKKALITQYLNNRGFIVESDTDLFESGASDSMGIIELVVFLEEKLGMHFIAANMIADNFRSIDAIVALIDET
jgi:acyl carrier protein